MKIVFTKGSAKHDLMEVFQASGAPQRVECPKQGIIPHDMVHFAVESTLQARGFLGRVRDGETAGFRMAAEAESDGVERLVEVIQGDAWSGGQTPATELLAMYQVTCAARQCPMLALDEAAVDAVRACMTDLSARWAGLPVGGRLELVL
ncbi:hypothetical protein KAK07_19460 [Ideonella sp. 4Y16]|uniref:Uncharacterized protein n=1 Tax=Ideonella alba TaxID=2824118 RepID=A0A941BA43_9BURK|nr:hypothetical protein [Ideonella alba]MBQ0929415.1 hypothetical protein [Ideonella alba]MBQ0945526.1 hypothetical protein [Ideonella alba]